MAVNKQTKQPKQILQPKQPKQTMQLLLSKLPKLSQVKRPTRYNLPPIMRRVSIMCPWNCMEGFYVDTNNYDAAASIWCGTGTIEYKPGSMCEPAAVLRWLEAIRDWLQARYDDIESFSAEDYDGYEDFIEEDYKIYIPELIIVAPWGQ